MPSEPSITHRRVFVIAGPAMLANLTTPLLGIVSTTAIGRLGDPHFLGGVALASVAVDCIFWLFGFLRMGTLAFTAQALGAGDRIEMRAVLFRALLLAVAIGLVVVALRTSLSTVIFGLMGASDAVMAATQEYFYIRLWSAPMMLGNYVFLGWLVGQARTGIALTIQIGINAVNIALTVFLVLVAGKGISGAATATVIAETSGFLGGLAAAWRILGGDITIAPRILFDRTLLWRLFAVNRDIMIRTASLIAAFLFFSAQGARAGDLTLAANAVLNNFLMIGSFFLDGLANAAEQLCGQSFGAGNRRDFSDAVKLVTGWSVAFGGVVTALFTLVGGILIDSITTSPEVRVAAREFMWLAALAPACGALAYCFDGIYIGASWARDMRNLMLTALAIYLAAWYCMTPFGNTGLWIAFLIFLMARGALQAARYPAMLRHAFARSAGYVNP